MIPVRLKGFCVVKQTEDHTCGFCAMSAVYKYYQLSPTESYLRERLGVDNTILPIKHRTLPRKLEKVLSETRGTLPPDLFSVLYEDGFDVDWRCNSFETYRADLYRHLKAGHPALALVDVVKHWVVINGIDNDGISIVDSSGYLSPPGNPRHRYEITHEHAAERFSGVILVSRGARTSAREMMTTLDYARQHIAGAAFGLAGGFLYGVRAFERWLRT